jgi:hypothetical protein
MLFRAAVGGVFAWIMCAAGMAQTLSLPQSTAKSGAPGTLTLQLETDSAKPIVALQWRFIFPRSILMDTKSIEAGTAAADAKKSLTCAITNDGKRGAPGVTYSCLLAGGNEPLGAGAVASVHYRIPTNAPKTTVKVQVDNALAVSSQLEKRPLANVAGSIVVQ